VLDVADGELAAVVDGPEPEVLDVDVADGEAAVGGIAALADAPEPEVPDVDVVDRGPAEGEPAGAAEGEGPDPDAPDVDVAGREAADGVLADVADVADPDVPDVDLPDVDVADVDVADVDTADEELADVPERDVPDGEATDREMTGVEGAGGVVPDGVAGDAVGVVGGVVVRREADVGVAVDPGLGVVRPAGDVSGRPGAANLVSAGAGGARGAAASRCTVVSSVPGVGVAGVLAVRGGAAEVSGRRCTATGSPELDAGTDAADEVALPAEAGVCDSFAVAVDASWTGCAAGARCTVDEPDAVAGDVWLSPSLDVVRGPRPSSVDAGVGEWASGGVTGAAGTCDAPAEERNVCVGGAGAEAPVAVRCT
jgi:hypothetical protein